VPDSDVIAQRVARNQATFRSANEQIEAAAEEIGTDLPRIPFICECPDIACTQTVRLPRGDYEAVRTDSTHFLVKPGHEVCVVGGEEVARIHSRRDDYTVMEKIHEAGEEAARLDERNHETADVE